MKNYPPPKRVVDDEELSQIAEKLTHPTAASKAWRHDFDAQREHVTYLEKIDPKYPGHSKCNKSLSITNQLSGPVETTTHDAYHLNLTAMRITFNISQRSMDTDEKPLHLWTWWTLVY